MLHIVLFEPEIPPNTGNIIRLAANTGAQLHLIHPLGFALDERRLRRAGLDYREFTAVHEYQSLAACLSAGALTRLFALTTHARRRHDTPAFASGDGFLFGPETRGLPEPVLARFPDERRLRIPMRAQSRSLNLSNAVAVVVFEAWRQLGFTGSV
ncbi:tRNA (cytosine34-2'-O-)-methyltransferase [Thioalkalivibrio nitratireducens DSM 14787]|uniref:tRNA (cytidine(34)-2'-O)-methyltransferase n=1 Tax=Thioalkalivibrio nitratireducens (strain DSM 14787 / UNIQEM 213 / ALEN2) TaxID=1255043 RepID=L0E2A8_THIND|nr:tRNA (cytidine(34)-2'-O)-methyltransferase [Thioalkalivibrio nitratireducens]AGA35362.1 tRNA (cytosine34-2'-O-)-methyltransferase [Thioalkalivibrio nitratireducens DSM 14787]